MITGELTSKIDRIWDAFWAAASPTRSKGSSRSPTCCSSAGSTTREESHGLGLFIRSLVGLDRGAATAAFDRFLGDGSLSANQLRFVQMIVEELTANGVMEVARLYEPPFTTRRRKVRT